MSKTFIFTIDIHQDGWDYKKGDSILVPVESNNSNNALLKLENRYAGSEYPTYEVSNVVECDGFLFRPIKKGQ